MDDGHTQYLLRLAQQLFERQKLNWKKNVICICNAKYYLLCQIYKLSDCCELYLKTCIKVNHAENRWLKYGTEHCTENL